MILRKVVIAGIALGAIAGFAVVSQPAEAGGCVVVSAETRGVVAAGANKRSHDKLTRHINRLPVKSPLSGSGDTMVTCKNRLKSDSDKGTRH